MKKYILIASMIMALLIAGCQSTGTPTERRDPRLKTTQVTLKAKVESIDLQKRIVVLRNEAGNLVTLKVPESATRFSEIKIGDMVTASYGTHLLAEFRDPTPEEEKVPYLEMSGTKKASKSAAPGGSEEVLIRAVVTVEVIDRIGKLVTVKGPRGNYATLPVEDESLLEDLKVGEVGVITYIEAFALAIEKTK